MSSHHIVREKQEPALLITSLAGFDPEDIGQLLEWSPTLVVTGELYEVVDSLGLKVDVVITDDSNLLLQPATRTIATAGTPLEDALKFLIGEQYPSVNILAAAFLLKDYALFAEMIDLVIYLPGMKVFPVRSGFSKWKVAGERIHVLYGEADIDVSGLKMVNAHLYETEKDGFYTLTFNQPFIFIGEDL